MRLLDFPKEMAKRILFPQYRFFRKTATEAYRQMPDAQFVTKMYKAHTGKTLNLDNPQTFCEKLQWLKVYDRRPEYTRMVDKAAAKEWVTGLVGPGHVIPTLGVWEHFNEIDFDALPDRFVLKCTHDSGSAVVCRDKASFDQEKTKKWLEERLVYDVYYRYREWVYKNVPHRILAEPYVEGLGGKEDVEYKLTCFDGKVGIFTVCKGIPHASFSDRTNDHYSREGEYMPFYAYYKNAVPPVPLPPEKDEIIAFAETLSAGIPQVRVDCYVIDGKVTFGEMTFYTWGGIIRFEPPEWDKKLGDMITLPEKRTE